MDNLSLRAVVECCNGIYHGDEAKLDKFVKDITTDSRKAETGSMFIAIKGDRSDGHDYIESVYKQGAICCISEKELPGITMPYIQVESSLQALKDIAEYYRSILDVKVVGITGSVGKTSTKETIASVLSQKYKVLKTLGNFNNEIGLPLTIFRLTKEDEIAVLEMGISDFGEMTRLTKIAKPDVCVITNIGLCHLENLKTRDGILQAKTEIFKSMNPNGEVVLNGDDDKLSTVTTVNDKKTIFFGIDNKSNIYADSITNMGLEGTKCMLHNINGADNVKDLEIHIPVAGHHMVYNAMAAAAVGTIFGLTSTEIAKGIENMETIAGRNHIIKKNGYTVIDDCYNANPVSMQASIDVINTALGRKVCILGDMFELGENEKQLHYKVGTYLASKNIDVLIAVGKLSEEIASGAREYLKSNEDAYDLRVVHFDTRDECIANLEMLLKEGDTILVKASHGMEFPKIVDTITK